jgi:hypothetical protein
MHLLLKMGKMAKEVLSRAAIEEKEYLCKNPPAEVREEKMRGVEFPVHNKVMDVIQGHPEMLRQNQMSGCLRCQNGTAKNL